MQAMDQFVAKHGIRATVRPSLDLNRRREWEAKDPGAHHYSVTLSGTFPGASLTVQYSMGSALKDEPTAAKVLDSLAMEASSVDAARGFEDWAADLGFDPDSRKAEKLYRQCLRQSQSLKLFLGEEAYEELLTGTERE
jgi:hypothetical protein